MNNIKLFIMRISCLQLIILYFNVYIIFIILIFIILYLLYFLNASLLYSNIHILLFSSLNGTGSDDSNFPIMQKFPRPKAVNKARWTKDEVWKFKIIFIILLITHINLIIKLLIVLSIAFKYSLLNY